MTHGAMVAIHAAQAAAKARVIVLDAFRIHGATAPERARPLADLALARDDHALAEFIKTGVIRGIDARGRETILGDDARRVEGYYLDEVAFIAQRDRKAGGPEVRVWQFAVAVGLALLGVVLAFALASRT